MITLDLIAYIQAQTRKNISREIIKSRLLGAGWHLDDVEEAFRKITPPTVIPVTPIEPVVSTTPIVEVAPVAIAPVVVEEKLVIEQKPIVPIKIIPKEVTQAPSQAPMAKPIFSTSFSEANPKPVFTPRMDAPVTPTTLEIRSEELMPSLISKVAKEEPVIKPVSTAPVVEQPLVSTVQQKQATEVLNPNPSPFAGLKMTSMPVSDTPETSNIPNGAILHSYKRALMSAHTIETQSSNISKKKIIKIILLVLGASIIGGAVFAFAGKYVPIPTFSFIKKDPKTLLITSPITLNELKAYKIETNAVISLPPLGNITTGLISGESVVTADKDTFSLKALGVVNHEDESMPVFDYKAVFKSSLFNNPLNIDLKYNNLVSLVTTPNLIELLGENSPEVANVIVSKGQFGAFIALLPDSVASKVEKINIDKLFSVGVPSYINDETSSIFKNFVDSATVVEKEPENVHGMLSYHYELSADQPSTKKFITEFVSVFTEGLTKEDKDLLGERLGAVSIDSFEVWVGKEDSKIHQYKITLKTPLSRLIGLDDSGIAGNVVTLDWQTTYYDFNVHNDIAIPTDVILVSEFMKKVSDMKIKDKISSFGVLAQSLRNSLGNYGTRSNQTGSCTNPNPSSLFSPVGHAKGGSVPVGNIASLMNDILSTTGGALACYSTSKEWALSAPLPSDPTTSFCADSTGNKKVLFDSITGPSCK